MKFSFIHTSDIHLGRAFSNLSESENKIEICAKACQKSFEKIINFALEKNVDFVLIAGDSFDNDEHDLSAKLIFLKNLKKLADNNIKTYVICGNHDPIEMYNNIKNYFQKEYNDLINITGITTNNTQHTYSPMEGVNIHTISFLTEEGENPTKFLPKISAGSRDFNIGLIHCDLDKTDSKYAPCSREDLRNLGYNYYALGHIHIPQDMGDNIIYSGTPQARTKKETGTHGCFYIQVEDEKITKEFIPVDSVRFHIADIDCTDFENKIDLYNSILEYINGFDEDIDLNLFEINLHGRSKIYKELLDTESILEEYTENFSANENENVSVHTIINNTSPDIEDIEVNPDDGVIGIISSSFNEDSDIKISKIYEDISEIHNNIYKKLQIDNKSKEFLVNALLTEKEDILSGVQKEIKSLCNEIYEMD